MNIVNLDKVPATDIVAHLEAIVEDIKSGELDLDEFVLIGRNDVGLGFYSAGKFINNYTLIAMCQSGAMYYMGALGDD